MSAVSSLQMKAAPAPAQEALARQVEQFLFREAWLLDHFDFEAWLDLYTDDAVYWVPLQAGQADPLTTHSLMYDDKRLMRLRVRQQTHPRAHARLPPPEFVFLARIHFRYIGRAGAAIVNPAHAIPVMHHARDVIRRRVQVRQFAATGTAGLRPIQGQLHRVQQRRFAATIHATKQHDRFLGADRR